MQTIMLQHLHDILKDPVSYSPPIAPHPDSSPPLLGTACCSAGGRPCVFARWCVHLVVVMSIFDHFEAGALLVQLSPRRDYLPNGMMNVLVSVMCFLFNCRTAVFLCQQQQRRSDAPTPPLPATQRRTTANASSGPKQADKPRRKRVLFIKARALNLSRRGFYFWKLPRRSTVSRIRRLTLLESYDDVPVHTADILLHNSNVFPLSCDNIWIPTEIAGYLPKLSLMTCQFVIGLNINLHLLKIRFF